MPGVAHASSHSGHTHGVLKLAHFDVSVRVFTVFLPEELEVALTIVSTGSLASSFVAAGCTLLCGPRDDHCVFDSTAGSSSCTSSSVLDESDSLSDVSGRGDSNDRRGGKTTYSSRRFADRDLRYWKARAKRHRSGNASETFGAACET